MGVGLTANKREEHHLGVRKERHARTWHDHWFEHHEAKDTVHCNHKAKGTEGHLGASNGILINAHIPGSTVFLGSMGVAMPEAECVWVFLDFGDQAARPWRTTNHEDKSGGRSLEKRNNMMDSGPSPWVVLHSTKAGCESKPVEDFRAVWGWFPSNILQTRQTKRSPQFQRTSTHTHTQLDSASWDNIWRQEQSVCLDGPPFALSLQVLLCPVVIDSL